MDHSSHGSMDHGSMDHGSMDHGSMNMDMDMSMTMGTFHWSSTGDALWFDSWMPKSEPAYIGACIGLFVFAIVSRGFLALEIYFVAWRAKRAEEALQLQDGTMASVSQTGLKDQSSSDSLAAAAEYPTEIKLPLIPPFSWVTDPVRSFLTTFTSFVSYLLMLVVMTGNGGFFIVIMVGIFIGEIAFGRFRSIGGIKGVGEHDH